MHKQKIGNIVTLKNTMIVIVLGFGKEDDGKEVYYGPCICNFITNTNEKNKLEDAKMEFTRSIFKFEDIDIVFVNVSSEENQDLKSLSKEYIDSSIIPYSCVKPCYNFTNDYYGDEIFTKEMCTIPRNTDTINKNISNMTYAEFLKYSSTNSYILKECINFVQDTGVAVVAKDVFNINPNTLHSWKRRAKKKLGL